MQGTRIQNYDALPAPGLLPPAEAGGYYLFTVNKNELYGVDSTGAYFPIGAGSPIEPGKDWTSVSIPIPDYPAAGPLALSKSMQINFSTLTAPAWPNLPLSGSVYVGKVEAQINAEIRHTGMSIPYSDMVLTIQVADIRYEYTLGFGGVTIDPNASAGIKLSLSATVFGNALQPGAPSSTPPRLEGITVINQLAPDTLVPVTPSDPVVTIGHPFAGGTPVMALTVGVSGSWGAVDPAVSDLKLMTFKSISVWEATFVAP
jgi:hypothetical protein